MHKDNSTERGSRAAPAWVTMAGVVFNAGNYMKKGSSVIRAAFVEVSQATACACLLGAGFAKAVTEFFNASPHVIDRFLSAGVKGVRLAGGVKLVKRQFTPVFHLDHFLGVGAGACHELKVVR